MAVPKKILDLVELRAGSKVRVSVENGCLVVEPAKKPHYTLTELLARCRPSDLAARKKNRSWLDSGPLGKEVF